MKSWKVAALATASLLVWAAMLGLLFGADGIMPGTAFKIPFSSDGKPVSTKAKVTLDAAGNATLTVLYIRSGEIEEAVYSLKRVDAPVPPVPPQPVPPTPVPVPVPPEPAPIPGAGLRVLILEDVAQRDKLTAGQREILFSELPGGVLDVMKKNCVKGADGKTPEYRVWNKTTDASKESATWQQAVAKAKALNLVPPAWLVSNGTSGVAGPLPATKEEALAVLKKVGGK